MKNYCCSVGLSTIIIRSKLCQIEPVLQLVPIFMHVRPMARSNEHLQDLPLLLSILYSCTFTSVGRHEYSVGHEKKKTPFCLFSPRQRILIIVCVRHKQKGFCTRTDAGSSCFSVSSIYFTTRAGLGRAETPPPAPPPARPPPLLPPHY